ncbi:hypothetical protein HPB51_006316 [Rhipicephalus microplus]|uniref:LIM zinc-binding domain-containing protein n=1 Tax=Rhipicephalus microplus TaxID=6941 RepID=A0A9J6ENG1_RHIMP|nr:hypothetical protein HPB51_006316 [Rhipicephalus microplus]
MNSYENNCLRCGQTVYQVDKVGPLKDFTFYHQGCFKCLVCGTKLTLKTYFNNQQSQEDKEVYCQNHVPKTGPGHLDGMSVGIKAALSVPKTNNLVNDQIRGSGKGTFDADALGIKSALTRNHQQHHEQEYKHAVNRAGRFDASALHITHALNATKVHRGKLAYERNMDEYLRIRLLCCWPEGRGFGPSRGDRVSMAAQCMCTLKTRSLDSVPTGCALAISDDSAALADWVGPTPSPVADKSSRQWCLVLGLL